MLSPRHLRQIAPRFTLKVPISCLPGPEFSWRNPQPITFFCCCCLSSRIKKQEQQEWTDGVCASASVCCCQFVRLLTVAVAVWFFFTPQTHTQPRALLRSARICSRGRFGVGAIWSGHRASCSSERDSRREAPRDAIKAVFHFQPLWVEHNC